VISQSTATRSSCSSTSSATGAVREPRAPRPHLGVRRRQHQPLPGGQAARHAHALLLLSAEELRQVLQRLGYELAPETLQRTIEYYEERSTQGSTLARVVHAWVSARADRADSWRYFDEALSSDIADIQAARHGGIHLGAMAGTIDILQRCCLARARAYRLEVRDDRLHLNRCCRPSSSRSTCPSRYRGHVLDIDIDHTRARVHLALGQRRTVRDRLRGRGAGPPRRRTWWSARSTTESDALEVAFELQSVTTRFECSHSRRAVLKRCGARRGRRPRRPPRSIRARPGPRSASRDATTSGAS